MALIGISLYAEDVNALSDMVSGPPCALSLSLHARAVLSNLHLPELKRIAIGVSELRSDIYPLRCGLNHTYKSMPNSPIFDEARASARFQIVWDVPGIPPENIKDVHAEVGSLPFVGGRVRHDRPFDCRVLTDVDVPSFMRGHFLSVDQQPFASRILREISDAGVAVDMRDLFRAVAWRHFWKREDADRLMQQVSSTDQGGPFYRAHPLMQWVDTHPEPLRFLPVGYRRLGEPMMNRPGMRETMAEMPHVYAEAVYGVHAWVHQKKFDESIPDMAWWTIKKPESESVFYAVGQN